MYLTNIIQLILFPGTGLYCYTAHQEQEKRPYVAHSPKNFLSVSRIGIKAHNSPKPPYAHN